MADRSGAVHALHRRRCGPETGPRFQPPLSKPGMRFSRTRLSEFVHRPAIGVAVIRTTIPPRGSRLRGPIQCPLEFSRRVVGVISRDGIHPRLPP